MRLRSFLGLVSCIVWVGCAGSVRRGAGEEQQPPQLVDRPGEGGSGGSNGSRTEGLSAKAGVGLGVGLTALSIIGGGAGIHFGGPDWYNRFILNRILDSEEGEWGPYDWDYFVNYYSFRKDPAELEPGQKTVKELYKELFAQLCTWASERADWIVALSKFLAHGNDQDCKNVELQHGGRNINLLGYAMQRAQAEWAAAVNPRKDELIQQAQDFLKGYYRDLSHWDATAEEWKTKRAEITGIVGNTDPAKLFLDAVFGVVAVNNPANPPGAGGLVNPWERATIEDLGYGISGGSDADDLFGNIEANANPPPVVQNPVVQGGVVPPQNNPPVVQNQPPVVNNPPNPPVVVNNPVPNPPPGGGCRSCGQSAACCTNRGSADRCGFYKSFG